MDLLLAIDENKSHYVYMNNFDRLMFHKTKNKNKKYFRKSCLQYFSSKNVLTEHKEVCLSINGAQSVILEKGPTEFKQISVPFKTYANFECNLESAESYEGSYLKKYQDTFLAVLLTSLFVLIINLPSQCLFLEMKMLLMNLLKQFLRSMNTVKK